MNQSLTDWRTDRQHCIHRITRRGPNKTALKTIWEPVWGTNDAFSLVESYICPANCHCNVFMKVANKLWTILHLYFWYFKYFCKHSQEYLNGKREFQNFGYESPVCEEMCQPYNYGYWLSVLICFGLVSVHFGPFSVLFRSVSVRFRTILNITNLEEILLFGIQQISICIGWFWVQFKMYDMILKRSIR